MAPGANVAALAGPVASSGWVIGINNFISGGTGCPGKVGEGMCGMSSGVGLGEGTMGWALGNGQINGNVANGAPE